MSVNDKQLLLKQFEEELATVENEMEALEKRREALENTIDGIRELISLNGSSAKPSERPQFARNAFAHLGLVDGAVKFLTIVQHPQSTREVANALLLGGKKSDSANFHDMVRVTLLKESQKENPRILWVNHKWELPKENTRQLKIIP